MTRSFKQKFYFEEDFNSKETQRRYPRREDPETRKVDHTTTQTFSRLANAARPAQPSLLCSSPHVMTTDHRPEVMMRDNDNDSDDINNDDLMINDPPLQIL